MAVPEMHLALKLLATALFWAVFPSPWTASAEPLTAATPEASAPPSAALQSVHLKGKVQAQGALLAPASGKGDLYHTMELRRVRLGAEASLGPDVELMLELNPLSSDSALYEASLTWKKYEAFQLGVGKEKPATSLEEGTSSSQLQTLERSQINKWVAAPGPQMGVFASGQHGILYYGLGLYTDQLNRNAPDQDPRYLHNLQLGADLKRLKIQASLLASDDEEGQMGEATRQAHTLGFQLSQGSFKLQGEWFSARGRQEDLEGWYLMPLLEVTSRYEAVARLERALAVDGRLRSLPGRYTEDMPALTGAGGPRAFTALYLGWNWLLPEAGQKILTGFESYHLEQAEPSKVWVLQVAWRASFHSLH